MDMYVYSVYMKIYSFWCWWKLKRIDLHLPQAPPSPQKNLQKDFMLPM